MLKSAIIASAVLFGAAAPVSPTLETAPATAQQTQLNLPEAEAVIAQFAYLEISHGDTGFELSITDETAVFVNVEFPGNLHIRVGL